MTGLPISGTYKRYETNRANKERVATDTVGVEYLEIIDGLVDCAENSEEEELLELVSILVENYEAKYYPVEAPDPLEAIKIRMEEQGLKRKDMVDYFGSASRVSEVLNRKRPLTLEMIRKIHKGLGISAETLLAG
jgi:HTH-type transcriptional regulator/antitoxin HigA